MQTWSVCLEFESEVEVGYEQLEAVAAHVTDGVAYADDGVWGLRFSERGATPESVLVVSTGLVRQHARSAGLPVGRMWSASVDAHERLEREVRR